ncbi:MAG: hypothetical protein JXB15_06355, partial [Anaerolineales bacterium]|nr:hypothetical protein [Anaerolineales bacterium]
FTGEALLLLFLLARRVPGVLQVRATLLRVFLASAGAALLSFLLLQLPFSSIILALGALALGALLVAPFIWPEVKLLLKLG